MIKQIDISDFIEDTYILDNIEIMFTEEGLLILTAEGLFTEANFKKIYKNSENYYILMSEDKDSSQLTEEQYQIIKDLINKKQEKKNES
jgi:hypothetical protein